MSTFSEPESKGNYICATITQGHHNFDAQDLSTVHVPLVEHASLVPISSMSQDDSLAVIYDKEELCDSSLAISMPQLARHHDILNFESETSIANNHVIIIGSSSEEMRLLSSLNTLGYIEFDVLCNLSTLKKTFVILSCHVSL